jgi:hypothetical protein
MALALRLCFAALIESARHHAATSSQVDLLGQRASES